MWKAAKLKEPGDETWCRNPIERKKAKNEAERCKKNI